MLKYLIVQLDDTSTSYCHYENGKSEVRLIALDDLKSGIFYAMKENLMIQFVYPEYELPQDYKEVINSIDHSDIVSCRCQDVTLRSHADVVVFNGLSELVSYDFQSNMTCVVRTGKTELFEKHQLLKDLVAKVARVNLVITDAETFSDADFDTYKNILADLAGCIEKLYVDGKSPQLNVLTDRMMLEKMNNCNGGWENITLAPDGKFYVCPAFYCTQQLNGTELSIGDECVKGYSIGDLHSGPDIKNPQLYRLDHAPICRNCDAYQCRRCVWLNRKTTCEVNTPSHEQCVVAHLERNASRELLNRIRKHGTFLPEKGEIKEIDYLDPFEVLNQF